MAGSGVGGEGWAVMVLLAGVFEILEWLSLGSFAASASFGVASPTAGIAGCLVNPFARRLTCHLGKCSLKVNPNSTKNRTMTAPTGYHFADMEKSVMPNNA